MTGESPRYAGVSEYTLTHRVSLAEREDEATMLANLPATAEAAVNRAAVYRILAGLGVSGPAVRHALGLAVLRGQVLTRPGPPGSPSLHWVA